MNWPNLTPKRTAELAGKARAANIALTEVADAITVYPGGGSPAHKARVAAINAETCAGNIEEMTD